MASRFTDIQLEQMRARILTIARLDGANRIYPHGWVPAANFLRATDDQGARVEHEDEATAMLDQLVMQGLLEERGVDEKLTHAAFRHRYFRFTKKARQLWLGEIDPIPGIAPLT